PAPGTAAAGAGPARVQPASGRPAGTAPRDPGLRPGPAPGARPAPAAGARPARHRALARGVLTPYPNAAAAGDNAGHERLTCRAPPVAAPPPPRRRAWQKPSATTRPRASFACCPMRWTAAG